MIELNTVIFKKMSTRLLVIISCLTMLAACFYSGPSDNAGFGNITQLSDLDGIYTNKGDPSKRLSRIIWPNDTSLNHRLIDTIGVKAKSTDQLLVSARQDNKIVKEQLFVEGEDFNIRFGRIQLRNYIDGSSGDNAVSAAYVDIDLGIDEKGHGKYRKGGVVAGVALMIPIVAFGKDDVRFYRIEE